MQSRALAWGVAALLCVCGATAYGKPRLTIHSYDVELSPKMADEIEQTAASVYGSDARFGFVPFVDLLEKPAEVARLLGAADIEMLDAESAFTGMDFDKAKELLDSAVATYVRYLPRLAERANGITPLRDAWIGLAKVRFFAGDALAAKEALRYVMGLDPKVSSKAFPPQMKKLVAEERLAAEALGIGPVTIDSDPVGATAYVQGRKLEKPTPSDPVDAPMGPMYVSYERRNYAPVTFVFEHASAEPATATQALPRYPNNPLAPINRARAKLDAGVVPDSLKDASKLLGVDLIVLTRAAQVREEGSAPKWKLQAYLYDARKDAILRRTERVVAEEELAATTRLVARDVVNGIDARGDWNPVVPPKPSRWAQFSEKSRNDADAFYRWKGFWYVIGGVAVVAAVGIGVGVGVSAQQQTARNSLVLFGGN